MWIFIHFLLWWSFIVSIVKALELERTIINDIIIARNYYIKSKQEINKC